MNKIFIIGIGFKPLEEKAKQCLRKSLFIVSSPRLVEIFKRYDVYNEVKDMIVEIKKFNETIEFIQKNIERGNISLLASGDPLFYGVAPKIIELFGEERVEVFPDLSCVQKGLSLIKKSWNTLETVSFHGRSMNIRELIQKLSQKNLIAVLTDNQNSPKSIAEKLLSLNREYGKSLKYYVFERLGYEDEKISIFESAEELISKDFKEPNFLIVEKKAPLPYFDPNEYAPEHSSIIFGLKEEEIFHEKGMITKDEVRACIVHKLCPPKKGIVWDIGAGSGSVSLELAHLSQDLEIYAIEKGDTSLIEKNIDYFKLSNVKVIKGEAPECLKDLPNPVRVFIGGSGGRLSEILDYIGKLETLKVIVISAITMETLNIAMHMLEKEGFKVDATQVQATRLVKKHGKLFLQAQNPVIVVRGMR
jgi:precorrin-6Y C5,15-methyltransferase (decarboxylating)